MRKLTIVIAALFLVALQLPAVAESDRPMSREGDKIRELLLQGNFAKIEAFELRTRDLSINMEDGQQLRAALFDALGCACSKKTKEEQLEYVAAATRRIEEWRKAYPESNIARLAEAGILTQHAWALRGQGYARTVSESAWPLFREKIAEAAKLLDEMPASSKSEAPWYEARLEVARDQSMDRDQARALLREALEKHPRYMPLYFIGAHFYTPKWGGSQAELKAYIDDVAKRTSSWAGDTMYARMQWSEQGRDMFQSGQADWPRMKRAFEKVLADYPSPWNLNNFGKFACRAGDPDTTLQVLKKVEGQVILEAWGNMQFYAWCKDLASKKAAH